MNKWLLKTEPDCYSWEKLQQEGRTFWDGIHNYQARNNLRAMKQGDLAFIYHSGEEKRIMGIARIVREAYPDQRDPLWSWVDIEALESLLRPITLAEIKGHPGLTELKLIRQSRLSVCPISNQEWETILAIL